jgi:hypothetical protein
MYGVCSNVSGGKSLGRYLEAGEEITTLCKCSNLS